MAISLATNAATDALKVNRAPVGVEPQEVHKWLQSFNWDFKQNRTKYATKYHMANETKEQFKVIAKEYARMESAKDERQFGTLLDGLSRLGAGNRVHPRWGETMKVISNFLEVGEYNAIAASAMLWDSATAAEQKNGYLAQVLDEIRHTHQCAFINHYFSKHYHDPAGHNDARRTRAIGPLWKGMKRVFADGFISGDAVECSVNLQLVGEACFTNPLIVAVTEWASANGDEITPTVFLSVETDELRHMANGYQTVVSIANDPAAAKYLNTDLNNAFWTQQKYFTPALGYLFEYGSKFKVEPWVKTWNRWVYEDWGGIWIGRLGKYGVESPRSLRDAKTDAYWAHHDLALAAFALWPLGFSRLSLPDEEDPGLVRGELSRLGRSLRQDLQRVEEAWLREPQERVHSLRLAAAERTRRVHRSGVAGSVYSVAGQGLGFAARPRVQRQEAFAHRPMGRAHVAVRAGAL